MCIHMYCTCIIHYTRIYKSNRARTLMISLYIICITHIDFSYCIFKHTDVVDCGFHRFYAV